MPQVPISGELQRVLAEAQDISSRVGQPVATSHMLLAMFVVPNPARILLAERRISEDSILAAIRNGDAEAPHLAEDLQDKANQLAHSCDSGEVGCLHLLMGMTRLRGTLAFRLLTRSGEDLTRLRTLAMSLLTGGTLPRRYKPRTPPADLPAPRAAGSVVDPRPGASGGTASSLLAPHASSGPRVATAEVDPAKARPRVVLPADLPPLPPLQPASFVVGPLATPQPAGKKPPKAETRPGWWLDPVTFPLLNQLGKNLSQLAAQDKLDPVVGRAQELERIIDILGKRRANNPCLVGEPGVGKSALVEGLALRLHGQPHLLAGVDDPVVVELDMGALVAGTALRGAFSERMQGLKEELRKAAGRVVVFMDELHTLMGAGSSGEGPLDAANELKAALARGEFPCIGATTPAEFRKHIEKDPALARRFVAVNVSEPGAEESLRVLTGVAPSYTAHHQVEYSPAALRAAVQLADRCIMDRCLPGKALDVMDLAGSRARRQGKTIVDREDVARVVSELADVPLERLLEEDQARLTQMEAFLAQHVVGHGHAHTAVAQGIRRAYAGFSGRRPLGSFLFLGPTGVGKTETAKAVAGFLFGSDAALIRVDMGEYTEAHAVSRLLGSPPGYVGHDEGGQLTDAVRRRPHAVVLLDEVDKAHPEVLLPLLQVLDEGRLTDARGRTVSFRNCVLILTSNAGSRRMDGSERTLGFAQPTAAGHSSEDAGASREVLEAARRTMPAELWGRIDEKIVFAPLSRAEVAQVARLLLAESSRRLSGERGVKLAAGDDVVEWLMDHGGHDRALGVRPLRNAVARHVEALVANALLAAGAPEGGELAVVVQNGQLKVVDGRDTVPEAVSVVPATRTVARLT